MTSTISTTPEREDTSEFAKRGEYRFLEGGFVDLPTQVEAEDVTIEFERAVTSERAKFKTRIEHRTYGVEEVAEIMFRRLQSIDEESKDAEDPDDRTRYAIRFPVKRCVQIVQESLSRANIRSGRITDENRQKFLQALGSLRRKKAKRVIYKLNPKALITQSTKERQAESCSAGQLRKGDNTVFYGPGCEATLENGQREFFKEVQDPDGDFRAGREAIFNSHYFKTPLNLAIADGMPERKFIRTLCARENAYAIDAWLKNTPIRFYWIEYAWKKGNKAKRGDFSPDFFIKKRDRIFVVEIKGDEEISDPSVENQKKYEYAVSHFERLNAWLAKEELPIRYQVSFLSPRSYNRFFQLMRRGSLLGFRPDLDVALVKAVGESDSCT